MSLGGRRHRRHRPAQPGRRPAHRARPARCSWSPPATPGPDEGTVGTPGAADARAHRRRGRQAATTLADVLQPRAAARRRPALKPEITAPGVDIVAARAAGTSLGNPVDEHYTVDDRHLDGHPARRRRGRDPARPSTRSWDGDELKTGWSSTSEALADIAVYGPGRRPGRRRRRGRGRRSRWTPRCSRWARCLRPRRRSPARSPTTTPRTSRCGCGSAPRCPAPARTWTSARRSTSRSGC